MAKPASGGKISNRLVVMSSAAVLAVYAAGYVRTKSAADVLEARSTGRRPAPSRRPPAADTPAADTPAPGTPAQPAAERRPETREEPPVSVAASSPAPSAAPSGAAAKPVPGPRTEVAAVLPGAKPAPAPTPAAAAPEPAPAVAAAPVSQPAPEPPAAAAPPPAPVIPPPPPAPKWKDGTYTGWGTSRHGDIQAQVVIENGRIASATIAQCLTRYSCDVISKIIPQVAQRQSPDTDTISGATQSSDAFYYGVVEALGKAK